MILTVSFEGEDHSVRVHDYFKKHNRDFLLLDLANFPLNAALDIIWSDLEESYSINLFEGKSSSLTNVGVGWWRRVRPFSIGMNDSQSSFPGFRNSETSQAVNGLLNILPCEWVNPRKEDEIAHNKPYQWSVARSIGLKLPRTLVTNNPHSAKQFIEELGIGNVVYKAFLASTQAWRETRLVRKEDLNLLDHVKYAPVIFQEYISGIDLRITIVGDKIFAASIDASKTSYPVDMRMAIGETSIEKIQLPKTLEKKLLKLQNILGLQYGAIDMRKTEKGDYIFFEVNPAGQWLFIEDNTGYPIAENVAQLLMGKDDEYRIRT
ncbi:hypothetical protein [uncultured Psychroserpens sp.]|uniref:ATP-grasp domain-containing protein n=1 Tax=uncultured Psychroserpens sp. TaxID=255436 RepID=UPI00263908D6|nr:hypothetical protein [uncultured Psychroserpens sp.]